MSIVEIFVCPCICIKFEIVLSFVFVLSLDSLFFLSDKTFLPLSFVFVLSFLLIFWKIVKTKKRINDSLWTFFSYLKLVFGPEWRRNIWSRMKTKYLVQNEDGIFGPEWRRMNINKIAKNARLRCIYRYCPNLIAQKLINRVWKGNLYFITGTKKLSLYSLNFGNCLVFIFH